MPTLSDEEVEQDLSSAPLASAWLGTWQAPWPAMAFERTSGTSQSLAIKLSEQGANLRGSQNGDDSY